MDFGVIGNEALEISGRTFVLSFAENFGRL